MLAQRKTSRFTLIPSNDTCWCNTTVTLRYNSADLKSVNSKQNDKDVKNKVVKY